LDQRADVAVNGHEVLRRLERDTYDVILMDVQMPGMDGLEASRAVCARWPVGRRPRIIAMTAEAMEGDRERCLAAGMDEYLTKPVKPEELSAALNRLVDARAPEPARGPDQSGAPVVVGETAPEAGFDFTVALNYVGGDRVLLDELLGIFVEEAPVRMKAIQRAIAAGEAAELTREAHTIKGALKVIGATTAAGLAQGLEALGRDGNMSEADKLAVALERELDRLLQSLITSKRK